jgi:phospholipase/lecithinase/hemolysin
LRVAFADTTIVEFDISTLFLAARAMPTLFGISDVTRAYLSTNQSENPDTFMFWDEVHPTRIMHTWVGSAAYSQFGNAAFVSGRASR